MASIFSSTVQSTILSLLLSRLPLHPLDLPQQSSFTFKGNSGPSLHLTDITLDIDKLQSQYLSPSTPVNIRHAHVKDLKISISTSGIQIFVKGVTCVISPKASIENGQFLDPSNSIILKSLDDPLEGLEGMVESVVGFVDAVSGANSFTNSNSSSYNQNKDSFNNWEDEIDDDDLTPNDKEFDEQTKKLKEILKKDLELTKDLQKSLENDDPKTSNTLLSYAIEYIMGKVFVSLEDLNIKVIADPIVLNIGISKITANGSKTEKQCSIVGVAVSVIKPELNQENKSEKYYYEDNRADTDLKFNVNEEEERFVDNKENNGGGSGDDDHSDDDYDENLMASSFMAENKNDIEQSLLESAMYSTYDKSIYMSATQGDFYDAETVINEETTEDKEIDNGTLLLVIDCIKISLFVRKDLKLEIDNIKISLVPVPAFVLSFMDFLIQVSKQKKIFKQNLKKGNQKTNSHTNIVLQKFSIEDLKISINSKLSESGLYENPNLDIIHFSSFVLEQKSPNLIQGTLETFEVSSNDERCVYFDTSNSHPDIGLEIQIENNSNIISIIAEKPLFFNINYSLIVSILDFYLSLNPAIKKFHELKALNLRKYVNPHEHFTSRSSNRKDTNNNNNNAGVTKNSELIVKLNDISGVVAFSENTQEFVDFSVSPILYDTINKIAKLNLIQIMVTTSGGKADFKFKNLEYNNHTRKPAKFKIFDVITQKDILYNARKTFLINEIEFTSSFDVLDNIYKIFDNWISKIKAKVSKETKVKFQDPATSYQRLNSNFMSKSKITNYFGLVRKFAYSINNLNEEFGGLQGELQNVGITSLSENTHQVSIYEIQLHRVKNAHKEAIISRGNKLDSAPMLVIKLEKSSHFFMTNCLVNYSGKWLAMFEKDIGKDKYETQVSTNVNVNSVNSNSKSKLRKKLNNEFFVSLTDISIGLEPVNLQSKSILLINRGNTEVAMYNDKSVICQFTSSLISLLLIDDVRNINDKPNNNKIINTSMHSVWRKKGYVPIGSLNTTVIKVKINSIDSLENNYVSDHTVIRSLIDTQLDIEKINLNLCCDSTQCFVQLLKDLKKPVYFSYDDKYKEVTNEINVFDNIEFNFFENSKKQHIPKSYEPKNKTSEHLPDNDSKEDLAIVENFYDNIKTYSNISSNSDASYSTTNYNSASISLNSSHFETEGIKSSAINIIPLTFHVSVSEVEIELHDGYDWKETRIQIRRALKRVSKKAQLIDEHLAEDNEYNVNGNNINEILKNQTLVEETLYQSIMLGVGPKDDPTEIMNQISRNINGYDINSNKLDNNTQTIDLGKSKNKPLQLKRSIKNKVLIKLDDIDINFKLLSSNEPHLKEKPDYFSIDENVDDSEMVNQIEISINNLLIKDNVPTSSWNMFAGYMREAGEREIGKNMIKINIDLVRPVARLAAVEMILQINILPLRLYVDQDTLEFLTRFGEFKDQRFIPLNIEIEEMFIEKITIDKIVLKLDYKPKKIDYAGIRSGHTNEFMNIFILDESDITLNKVTLYGVPGFSKLNALLNGYWSPDVKKNQLGGVLSGLAPVRSIVNIGSGVNNLVTVPMREYKKDGRIVRSLQVGAIEFTKVTSGEILKFGAKLAAGTQTILENTEEVLGGSGSSSRIVRDSSGIRKEIIKKKEKKNSKGRRRSSTASFGDEEESDYHRYYFFDKKNMNDDYQNDHRSKIINEAAIEDEDGNDVENDDNGNNINHDKSNESGNISDSDFDSSSDKGFDSRISITKNQDMDKLHQFEDETYVVSLYSDQPESFNEGLRTAYNSIQKNFSTAKDALYEAGIRASESKTASAALVELAKATPIVFIRPAIAATEAISKSLLGGVNNINPDEKIKAEEKYKTTKRKGDNTDVTEENKDI